MGNINFNPCAARSKRPCPIWVDAFHRETQHLSADEIGAYFLIIMAMWSRKSCDFPNNERQLAQVSRVSTRLWKSRISVNIMGYFDVVDGCVISSKLRKEATYVERHVTQQRCRKTGEKPDNLLKDIDWHPTAVKTTDEPRPIPTQQPNNPTKGSLTDSCHSGIQEAVEIYNKYSKQNSWSVCEKFTKTRQAKMRARLKDAGGLEGWVDALDRVKKSPFLMGQTNESFRMGLDFILQESSFVKLMEGKYDGRGYKNGNSQQNGSIGDWADKAASLDLTPPPDGT